MRKQTVDPLRAARELNVQIVAKGSIQKSGTRLRVQFAGESETRMGELPARRSLLGHIVCNGRPTGLDVWPSQIGRSSTKRANARLHI